MKIAIVVGHTQDSPGACSPHGIECEFFYNSVIADLLSEYDVYHYDTYKDGYTAMVKRNAAKLNAQNYDLVVELHYNAAYPAATGCEVLYYHTNNKGGELATFASKLISDTFNIKNRGSKGIEKTDRGGGALYYPKATTILLEPFFGTNEEDVKKFKGKEETYAETIKKIITKWEQLK